MMRDLFSTHQPPDDAGMKTISSFAALSIAPVINDGQALNFARPNLKHRLEVVTNAAQTEAEVLVYGDIGEWRDWWTGEEIGVSVKGFLKQLDGIPASVTTLRIRINSYGGLMADAAAIYSRLVSDKRKKITMIDGVCMSAAVMIFLAGDERIMPDNGVLMIHDPSSYVYGDIAAFTSAIKMLEAFKTSALDTYATRTGGNRDELSQMMSDTTYFAAEQAVALGFATAKADAIPVTNSAGHLDPTVLNKAPEHIKEMIMKIVNSASAQTAQTPAAPTQTAEPAAPATPVVAPAATAVSARQTSLVALAGRYGCEDEVKLMVDAGISLDDVTAFVFDKAKKADAATPTNTVTAASNTVVAPVAPSAQKVDLAANAADYYATLNKRA